jgi:hypothetical protein
MQRDADVCDNEACSRGYHRMYMQEALGPRVSKSPTVSGAPGGPEAMTGDSGLRTHCDVALGSAVRPGNTEAPSGPGNRLAMPDSSALLPYLAFSRCC